MTPEKDIVRWVEKLVNYAQGPYKKWLEERRKCIKAYYEEVDPSEEREGQIWVRLNKIRPKIDKKIGRVSMNRPMPVILPRNPDDEPVARIIRQLHEWKAEQERVWDQFLLAKRSMFISGLGVVKEYFDPEKDDGLGELSPIGQGDIVCEWVDEKEVLIDPQGHPPHYDDARFIIHIKKIPRGDLEEMYPKLKGKALKRFTEHSTSSRLTVEPAGDAWANAEEIGGPSHDPQGDMVEVREVWFKKRVTVVQEIEGEKVEIPKEEIWVTTVCGEEVLEPPHSSPYRHGKWPFVFFVHTPKEGRPYPVGEIHWLRALNEQYNVIHSILVAQAVKTQNPTLFTFGAIPRSEEGKISKIGSKPQVINLGTSAKVEWFKPAPISSALNVIAQILQFAMDDVASMPEVRAGKAPWAGISGVAIQQLAGESAMAEVQVERRIEAAYTRWLQLRISNIQQFMTLETAIRIVEEDTGEARWIPVNRVVPENYEPAEGERVTQREVEGRIIKVLNDITVPKFDLKYTVDSSKEQTKMERQRLALELFNAGAIDVQALLEQMEYPSWREILRRVEQKNQALALGKAIMEDERVSALVQALLQNPNLTDTIFAVLGGVGAQTGGETTGPPVL